MEIFHGLETNFQIFNKFEERRKQCEENIDGNSLNGKTGKFHCFNEARVILWGLESSALTLHFQRDAVTCCWEWMG